MKESGVDHNGKRRKKFGTLRTRFENIDTEKRSVSEGEAEVRDKRKVCWGEKKEGKEDRQKTRTEQCMLDRAAQRPGKARVAVLYD